MSITHDQYLKYVSTEVLDETLYFHAKGNYSIHKSVQHLSTLHHVPKLELEKLTGNELKLNPLPPQADWNSGVHLKPLHPNHSLHRKHSCEHFEKRMLDFKTIQSLLAPLLRKADSTNKRGYPSGGALYPIEVFCINLDNRINDWPSRSSVLHLLPSSRAFETHSPHINIKDLALATAPCEIGIGAPAFALIYCIYLPKALFKYRHRGYRLALMETGSMYMLIDLRCKELELNSRPWSGFTDYQIAKQLNLNPALFLPSCIQLIG